MHYYQSIINKSQPQEDSHACFMQKKNEKKSQLLASIASVLYNFQDNFTVDITVLCVKLI